MTKIDIFSGFLGAGKTTLIKKLLNEAYKGKKVVLIENEFGEIGIDGGFLRDAGVEITEMNSGCICCSLVGDFAEALKKVLTDFTPDRILIEPSGVGKLSDVIKAVKGVISEDVILNSYTAVVDAKKCKMYMKNFGEFYNDQIEYSNCIVLSHTAGTDDEKIKKSIELIREKNHSAAIVSTDWDKLSGEKILEAMEGSHTLGSELAHLEKEELCPECGGHHHHHHQENHCECKHGHGHNHEHNEHCDCEHEHRHEHSKHCNCEHEHHHEHIEHCDCGHNHHHHHHADEVFASWGIETTNKFTHDKIKAALCELENSDKYGQILRAKGIVAGENDEWIYFDYIPGESDVRTGTADIIGRICVIGANLNTDKIQSLFN